jgi:tetratricopeptide (TPR) repeat protein
LLEFYLHTAHAADRLINRDRQPLALPAAPPGTVTNTGFQDEKQALVWFAAECGNLLALLEYCVHTGWDGGTFRLASAMAHYLYRSGQWIDQEAANRLAVAAADRDGAASTRAHARYHLARVCLQLGRHVEAESLLRQALRLCGEADDPALLGEVHHVLGWVLERQARPDEAFGEVDKALKLFEGNAHAIGQARALNTLAWFHTLLGRHDDAIVFSESSLELHRDLDHREGRASALHTLGFALHHRGEHHRAAACYEAALELFRVLGLRYYQGSTLDSIADTLHAMGDHAAAVTSWRESLTILEELRHPAADAVRAKLACPRPGSPADHRLPR